MENPAKNVGPESEQQGVTTRPMDANTQERSWFWLTLALSSITIVGLVFAIWELVESRFFRDLDYVSLHYLYISRGIVSSLVLAFWAAWYVLRERKAKERALRRSGERYRGLLEASPGAVALYDVGLQVCEWNVAAERLYGFEKGEVLGRRLPSIPPQRESELAEFLRQVEAEKPVLDRETERQHKDGTCIQVQLSLLPFRERHQPMQFLEVTQDIRERVRLRETLLQLEKLTTMGQMAAGTAHHLNTPLASALLRIRMMREGSFEGSLAADLERLEGNMRFCQQFVRRLLDFSRRPQAHKQPELIGSILQSVISFLAPQVLCKRVRLVTELREDHQAVLADRNELEALFLILLSNALDAVATDGTIAVRCDSLSPDRLEVQIADDGCGIETPALAHVFEPFFTTKPPGKGTGLGLAIAKNIVDEHAGSIRLETKAGGGTTARIELPLWQEAAVAKGAHA